MIEHVGVPKIRGHVAGTMNLLIDRKTTQEATLPKRRDSGEHVGVGLDVVQGSEHIFGRTIASPTGENRGQLRAEVVRAREASIFGRKDTGEK